jgi:hypothetical protein
MDLLDDFDDGLADLVGMDDDQHREPVGGPPSDLLKPRKLSQVIAESGRAAKKAKVGVFDGCVVIDECDLVLAPNVPYILPRPVCLFASFGFSDYRSTDMWMRIVTCSSKSSAYSFIHRSHAGDVR